MATIAPAPDAKGIRVSGLPPGTPAPPFKLPASPDGKRIALEDLRGAPVLLVFYPADFTPVCSGELSLFNELLPGLERMGARVLGISVDPVGSHIGFAADIKLKFPLLSDFHPKGEVSRRYLVYREEEGLTERAQFLIDGEGRIAWSQVGPIELNPGADGAIAALERLTGRRLEVMLPPASAPGGVEEWP